MALNPKAIVSRIQLKTMNSNQAEVIRQLEALGYDIRLEGSHASVITPSGRELIRIPLVQLAGGELPPDLLNRRD
jgi:predicted RNA binding protein YcfA (HicA-like mRNA interferase family)